MGRKKQSVFTDVTIACVGNRNHLKTTGQKVRTASHLPACQKGRPGIRIKGKQENTNRKKE